MLVLFRILLISIALFWSPPIVAISLLWAYMFWFGPVVPVGLAILIDWYYLAPVPYLTLAALVAVVTIPFVQRRLVFYTT